MKNIGKSEFAGRYVWCRRAGVGRYRAFRHAWFVYRYDRKKRR